MSNKQQIDIFTEKAMQCDLCGVKEAEIIEICVDPYKVLRCISCGLVYVYPHPEIKEINDAYKEKYYSEWLNKQSTLRIRMWKDRLDMLETAVGKKGELLDVGCGIGTFIEMAAARGWDVTATELSKYATGIASKRTGTEVFNGQLEDARYENEQFDLITIWHVLEHTKSPLSVLKECARILKKGGMLVVAVPNFDNNVFKFFYGIVRRKKLSLFHPDAKELHLFHFSTTTIRMALEKSGFKLQSIIADTGQIGLMKRTVDFIARVWSILIGRQLYSAMIAISIKNIRTDL